MFHFVGVHGFLSSDVLVLHALKENMFKRYTLVLVFDLDATWVSLTSLSLVWLFKWLDGTSSKKYIRMCFFAWNVCRTCTGRLGIKSPTMWSQTWNSSQDVRSRQNPRYCPASRRGYMTHLVKLQSLRRSFNNKIVLFLVWGMLTKILYNACFVSRGLLN